MKVIYNKILPVKGFSAISLFGLVFARSEHRPLPFSTLRHEAIHAVQQKEWLYVGFFVLYFIEWICKGYRNISFEKEAYRHEDEPGYLQYRKHFSNYRRL